MKFSVDFKYAYMTLYEWATIKRAPENFWKHSQKRPSHIDWLPAWPKIWIYRRDRDGKWMVGHLHIGPTGRAYFYHAEIRLRPTKKEFEYIEYMSYRLPHGYNCMKWPPPEAHMYWRTEPQETY